MYQKLENYMNERIRKAINEKGLEILIASDGKEDCQNVIKHLKIEFVHKKIEIEKIVFEYAVNDEGKEAGCPERESFKRTNCEYLFIEISTGEKSKEAIYFAALEIVRNEKIEVDYLFSFKKELELDIWGIDESDNDDEYHDEVFKVIEKEIEKMFEDANEFDLENKIVEILESEYEKILEGIKQKYSLMLNEIGMKEIVFINNEWKISFGNGFYFEISKEGLEKRFIEWEEKNVLRKGA